MAKVRIALTGGIGSGKSTVAELFARRGVAVIDADRIAHQLTGPKGAAMPDIVRVFGAAASDAQGALARAWMRQLVFDDADARRRLEAVLHPMIRDSMLSQCEDAPGRYALLVIPLLFETGQDTLVHRVLVVDLPVSEQIARVRERDGLEPEIIERIIASQVPRSTRLQGADDVIDNSASPDKLETRVAQLHELYAKLTPEMPLRTAGCESIATPGSEPL